MDADVEEMAMRLRNYGDDIENISAMIDRYTVRHDDENVKIYGKTLKEKIQKIMDELINLDISPSLQLLIIKFEECLRLISIYGENVEIYGINIDPEFISRYDNEFNICSENYCNVLKDVMHRSMDEYERFSYDIKRIDELLSVDNLLSNNNKRRQNMIEDQDIGDDNVIIGNRIGRRIGSRNVIINDNTILNRTDRTAIGHNAKAGLNSIAIGSGAGAGSDLFLLLNQLKEIVSENNDPKTAKEISSLISELKEHPKNKSKIKTLWDSIKVVVTIGSATKLIAEITTIIGQLIA